MENKPKNRDEKKTKKKRKAPKKRPGQRINRSETVKGTTARLALRRQQAFDLRIAHLTYREIGKALGVATAVAWKDVDAVITDLHATTRETAEKSRKLELESLDEIERTARIQSRDAHRAAYETFYQKKDDEYVEVRVLSKYIETRTCRVATQTIMDCKRRRAKLIGLDAPTKHLVEIANVTRIFQNHNSLIGRLVEKFVPRDLRPQLSQEFAKILESSVRSIRPANLEGELN